MTETIFEQEADLPNRIYDSFEDKTIFLTGGTGFLGKVVTERILRHFDIKRIYLLVRFKRNKDPETRLSEMFTNELYDKVRELKGDEIFQKCKIINGDVAKPDLGLSPQDRELLIKQVEFIIHCAATVRFDEPLKRAVTINTKGTRQMLDIAKEMEKLQVFVHVSTAYCHPEEKVIYEKFYPCPVKPETVMEVLDLLSDEEAELLTPLLLADSPNTYTYSKALAEDVVAGEVDNLPLIIIRPSIVIPIWKEPIPGWTDNINGPTGMLLAAGKGVLRSIYGKKEAFADFVSVDGVSDAMFGLMAYRIVYGKTNPIFNLCTSNELLVTWGQIIDIGRTLCMDVPFDLVLWFPGGQIRDSKITHLLALVFYHYLPALVVDAIAFCFGYKPFLWKVQKRIQSGLKIVEYYINNEWSFNYENGLYARKRMNAKERTFYLVDTEGANMKEYFTNCALSARRYLVKDPEENLPRARRVMKFLYWLDKACNVLIKVLMAYLVYKYVYLPICR